MSIAPQKILGRGSFSRKARRTTTSYGQIVRALDISPPLGGYKRQRAIGRGRLSVAVYTHIR